MKKLQRRSFVRPRPPYRDRRHKHKQRHPEEAPANVTELCPCSFQLRASHSLAPLSEHLTPRVLLTLSGAGSGFSSSWHPVRPSNLSVLFGHPKHDAHFASRLQALQVLLRHIENIYLSQAGLQKKNHLVAGITNSTLCRPW